MDTFQLSQLYQTAKQRTQQKELENINKLKEDIVKQITIALNTKTLPIVVHYNDIPSHFSYDVLTNICLSLTESLKQAFPICSVKLYTPDYRNHNDAPSITVNIS